MNKVIIDCPFGNYLNFDGATSVLGTFTWNYRGGIIKRIWKILRTVRYSHRQKSWINRLGLPNPGISSLSKVKSYTDIIAQRQCIISIHGFNSGEWLKLIQYCYNLGTMTVTFNYSCPNVGATNFDETREAIEFGLRRKMTIIAKLAPVRWVIAGKVLHDLGIRHFHLCNTIPTPGGGISGKPLIQYSLWAINDFRDTYGNFITIIGGGGITNISNAKTYIDAGADHIALGSMLFNPFNHKIAKRIINELA